MFGAEIQESVRPGTCDSQTYLPQDQFSFIHIHRYNIGAIIHLALIFHTMSTTEFTAKISNTAMEDAAEQIMHIVE
jgi:hypothetical protein